MNLIFHTLTLRNFLSYGNNHSTFDLNFDDPTLIFGENHDSIVDGQIDSNGAGKTTILNGIMYALYGRLLSDIKMTNVINNINKKDMEVSLIFEINKVFYKITRFRKNKELGGDGIILLRADDIGFTKNKKDITPDSINNTNTVIVDIIKIPYEICARIVVFSATYDPFLSLPLSHESKANQKDIIEELFNLTILTKKAKSLKLKIKNDTLDFNNLVTFEERLVNEQSRYNQQLENAHERLKMWDDNKKSKIKKLNNEQKELSSIDYEKELKILEIIELNHLELVSLNGVVRKYTVEYDNLNNQLKQSKQWEIDNIQNIQNIQNKLSKYDDIDFDMNIELFNLLDKINSNLNKTDINIWNIQRSINSSISEIDSLKDERKKLKKDKCPYCLQQFSGAKSKLLEISALLDEMKSDMNINIQKSDKKTKKLGKLESQLKSVKSELSFKSISELNSSISSRDTCIENLKTYEKIKNPHNSTTSDKKMKSDLGKLTTKLKKAEDDITGLKLKSSKTSIFIDKDECYTSKNAFNIIDTSITTLISEVNPHIETVKELDNIDLDDSKQEEINALDKKIEHSKFLVKLLTKKDSFLRKALLNKNIPFLNNRLKIYLDKIGLPHKVQFNFDMTTTISQFGNEIAFSNLSSGQKARINLALSFAFRDVLQAGHNKVNFCILDECLDVGLSNVGVMMAAKMLKSIAKEEQLSMFIISHRDEIVSMYDSQIIIELKQGFSNIKKGD